MSEKSKKGMLLPPAIGYSFKIVLDLIRKNKIGVIRRNKLKHIEGK